MTLRKKAVLLALTVVAFISVGVYLVSYRLIQEKFDGLEDRRVRLNLERIHNALRHETEHLETLASDYATWDRTYEYMASHYEGYAKSEISDETFTSYGVGLFSLIDTSGHIALCRSYPSQESACSDRAVMDKVASAVVQLSGPSWSGSGAGVVVTRGGPMLVAIRPVLKTDGGGPSRGALVIAQPLDDRAAAQISHMLAFALEVSAAKDPRVWSVYTTQLSSVSGSEAQFVQVLDADRVVGFLRVDDLEGRPALVFRTELARDLHREGVMVQRVLFGELFAIVVLMAAASFVMLQRTILKPIAALSATADSITVSRDLSVRSQVTGSDEFGSLGRTFNAMLEELESSRKELLIVQESLEYRVRHDGLTGVLNRNAIAQELIAESSRCKRQGTTVAVMMADLDHFKRINDALGHAAGDEALRRTCDVIHGSLRPYDRIGRFGGEEFLILAPDVTKDDAIRLAERIRATISAIALSDASGCSTTISIGVTVTDGVEDWRDVVCAADAGLYEAKKSGRNRVEFIACDGMSQPPGCQSVFCDSSTLTEYSATRT